MKGGAQIRITDARTDMQFIWAGFDGDDSFSDFHIDVTSDSGTHEFRFGPCAVYGLRRLGAFFRDDGQVSVSLGFQNPDTRSCDLLRADDGYRLIVRFEGDRPCEEFSVRNPSLQVEDDFLLEY